MKHAFFIVSTLAMLCTSAAKAEVGQWTFAWDTSRSSGGEGFYHISSNTDTIQTETLNGLEWTFQSNTSVTAYTASAGQYFGSAKSPVKHATLTTDKLMGKVKEVQVEAKKKVDTDVTIAVSVNSIDYTHEESATAQLDTAWAKYCFVPAADEEGLICITMDQTSETTGPIYFRSLTIVYDGEGVSTPEVERVSPELSYGTQTVTLEAGDDAFANYLTNPYNVSPITYKAADESIAVIGNNGNIFTTGKAGETTVTATFAGNDRYLPDTASYQLVVVAKPVIEAPTVNVPGGRYSKPVSVVIKSESDLCKAIWYSTTANDSIELVDEPTIKAGRVATITIDHSCTLRCCAVDYNNIGCVLTADYVISDELTARIGMPDGSYFTHEGGALVPTGKPVIFRDASVGDPEAWMWTFEGADIASSNEQNPTVTYSEEGLYGVSLEVKSGELSDTLTLENVIKAGGAADVWNVEPEESETLTKIELGWYGSYAGSNWLGMAAFAEHFDAPLDKASIDTVSVYFASTTASNRNAEIKVSICLPDADGMPGVSIAESKLKVSELKHESGKNVPTHFAFSAPVELEGEFFVCIDGFPNAGGNDDVAVLCARRNLSDRSTVYHLLEDEDANYNPLGTYTWFWNVDEPVSLALTAHLSYPKTETGCVSPLAEDADTSASQIFDLYGRRVTDLHHNRPYIIRKGAEAKTILLHGLHEQ
ncbi:MAG: PKD domain-containing protein [Bacteroidales bacterium]|nr:PKD domain-containing protein [Candidatus Liminaster caballi]